MIATTRPASRIARPLRLVDEPQRRVLRVMPAGVAQRPDVPVGNPVRDEAARQRGLGESRHPGARRDPDVYQQLDARSLQHADEVANASAAVPDRHEHGPVLGADVGHQPVKQGLDGPYAPSPR